MIPGLNDTELESILEASSEAGAAYAGYILIRLPLEVKDLFVEWIKTHYPNKAARVLGLIKETREGKLYYSEFGTRMSGTGHYAEMLAKRFQVACRRFGLNMERPQLDTGRFRVPPRKGDQVRLF